MINQHKTFPASNIFYVTVACDVLISSANGKYLFPQILICKLQ